MACGLIWTAAVMSERSVVIFSAGSSSFCGMHVRIHEAKLHKKIHKTCDTNPKRLPPLTELSPCVAKEDAFTE